MFGLTGPTGKTLHDWLKEALIQFPKHALAHQQLTAQLPKDVTQQWSAMFLSWQHDHSLESPFVEPAKGLSLIYSCSHTVFTLLSDKNMDELKAYLHAQDSRDAKMDSSASRSSKSHTATQWLVKGLEIEEKQWVFCLSVSQMGNPSLVIRRLLAEALKVSSKNAPKRKVLLEEKNLALIWEIQVWRSTQQLFMPGLDLLVPILSDTDIPHACNEDLHLPSSFSHTEREKMGILSLAEKDEKLRQAQGEDALIDIWRHLHISLLKFQCMK